jgi:competence protein ComEA
MLPALREVLSRFVARTIGSPFAKPLARVTLAAAGLVVLALIGNTAIAGGGQTGSAPAGATSTSPASASVTASTEGVPLGPPASATAAGTSSAPAHGQASPDDPVILNTASTDDLRRLPGVGQKRADAIVALRTHLGRFRAVEDLLKVKGIGRATLRRLRPLVRLDPPPVPDAGNVAIR